MDKASFTASSLLRLTGSSMNSQTSFRNMLSSKNESSPLKQSNRKNCTSCELCVLKAVANTASGTNDMWGGEGVTMQIDEECPNKHAEVIYCTRFR